MPDDLVQVLKTQDAGYIRTHKAMEESVGLFFHFSRLELICAPHSA